MTLQLVIGAKNYSSWSLRAWLALEQSGAPYEEILVPFDTPDWRERVRRHSPSGKVPVLRDDGLVVWDSLAIVEYLAEKYPRAGLWPEGAEARALARSLCAEMHAGFAALRENMPMDLQAQTPGRGHTPEALADAVRIQALWRECRARFGAGGPYLFGVFSAADCFYAPVVFRFLSYGVPLDDRARAYAAAITAHPSVARWRDAALAEPPMSR